MKNFKMVLVCIVFFAVFVMFVDVVSAVDGALDMGDGVQSAVDNVSDNDTIIIDGSNGSVSEYNESLSVDEPVPVCNVSLGGGVYNSTQVVDLTVNNSNVVVYYTLDGSDPTVSSLVYSGPITLFMDPIFRTVVTLKFMAVDGMGNQGQIQTETYILTLPVVNANTDHYYSKIQDAINNALNGHIIELYSGTFVENLIINKKITLKPVEGNEVIIQSANISTSVLTITNTGSGSTIQGLNIKGATNSHGIYVNAADNCTITKNTITNNKNGLYARANNTQIQQNTIHNNTQYSIDISGLIFLV